MLVLLSGQSIKALLLCNRFALPPNLTLKNFEGLDLGTIDRVNTLKITSFKYF